MYTNNSRRPYSSRQPPQNQAGTSRSSASSSRQPTRPTGTSSYSSRPIYLGNPMDHEGAPTFPPSPSSSNSYSSNQRTYHEFSILSEGTRSESRSLDTNAAPIHGSTSSQTPYYEFPILTERASSSSRPPDTRPNETGSGRYQTPNVNYEQTPSAASGSASTSQERSSQYYPGVSRRIHRRVDGSETVVWISKYRDPATGRRVHVGSFYTPEDASRALEERRRELGLSPLRGYTRPS